MNDPEQYLRVKGMLSAALEVAPEKREALLEELAPLEPELRQRTRDLLAGEAAMGNFLGTEAPLPGAYFAGFKLIRLVGRGGSGLVFEAQQQAPRRRVALKLMLNGDSGHDKLSRERWQRFRAEGEVMAHMNHPAISRVIETGVHADAGQETAYLAVEWITGASDLMQHLRQNVSGQRARLELMLSIIEAIEHAHQRGVVHRDLKPGNILIDSDGLPHVIDFGVAQFRADGCSEERLTRDHGFLGTLAYASPEQCGGNPRELGPATDVHALGILLYEALCDRHPFGSEGKSITQLLQLIQHHPPRKPISFGCKLPADLEALIHTALHKDPTQRYPHAGAMAEDLRRFLAGHAVLARPTSAANDARLFLRRHRTESLAALSALVAVGVAIAAVVLFMARRNVLEERAQIDSQATTDLVAALISLANPRQHDVREFKRIRLLDEASAHLAENPLPDAGSAAELHATLGSAYRDLGHHTPAIEQLELAARLVRDMEPPQAMYTVGVLNTLGHALVDANQHARATSVLNSSLDLQTKGAGVPSFYRAITRSHLACAQLGLGNLDASEEHANFALETYRQQLGERHRSVPRALSTLASVYLQRGWLERAHGAAQLTLELDLENHGESALLSARSHLLLARVLDAQQQTLAAQAEADLSARIYASLIGPEHPERRAAEQFQRGVQARSL